MQMLHEERHELLRILLLCSAKLRIRPTLLANVLGVVLQIVSA